MSPFMIGLTILSLAGLLAIAIYHFIQSKNMCRFILHVNFRLAADLKSKLFVIQM